MKHIEIRKEFINRFMTLNSFSGCNFIKNENVAFPNETFTPPTDNKYFRLSFNPDTPETIGMYNCDQQRYYGFFQIDICSPKNKGLADSDNKFEWICKLFKEGTSFEGIDIEKVYLATTSEEDNLYRTVVRVNFTADVNNK